MDEARVYGAKECGSCRWWRAILEDGRGPIGPCRLQVRTGDFPGTAPACERHLSREAAIPSAPPQPVERRRNPRPTRPLLHRAADGAAAPSPAETAVARPSPRPAGAAPVASVARPAHAPAAALPPLPEELTDMTREEFAQAIREALRDEGTHVPLAPRWEGGTVLLKPGDAATQSKEIPLDGLFHKIVMIRDRLRVLEQKINAHEKLSDAEKVDMQQYVTRCYGSLTTFNLLFRDERDRFTGDKSAG